MRKTLIIIGGALLIIGFGFLMYILFFMDNANIEVTTPQTTRAVFPVAQNNPKPITQNESSTTNNNTSKTISSNGITRVIQSRLTQISKGPIVPSVLSTDSTSTTTSSSAAASSSAPFVIVQYIEQRSGNMYQYNSATGIKTRTSNKTIPGIQSAAWLSDGSLAYVQYISQINIKNKNISTYALPKNGSGGFFLPQGLSEVLAKGTRSLLAISSDKNGSIAKKASVDASNVHTAFQTPLSAIRVMFAGPKNYIAYTKPSATIGGYVFYVNSTTGFFTPIIGPLKGLVALVNHAGTNMLVSYIDNNNHMAMELVSIPTRSITSLPVSTIADKCVWSQDDSALYCGIPQNPPNVMYPDGWYQGATSFTDQIWKINITGNYVRLLLDFTKKEGKPLDTIALSIDPKQQFLSFVNKRTSALWIYRLMQ